MPPKGTTARQFLQMVMRGEIDPIPKQFNAAKVLIEYQEAKLSAVALGHFDGQDFASALERAILRSQAPYVPRPAPQRRRIEEALHFSPAQSALIETTPVCVVFTTLGSDLSQIIEVLVPIRSGRFSSPRARP